MLETVEEIYDLAACELTRRGHMDVALRLCVRWEPRYTRRVASARYRRSGSCIRVSSRFWPRLDDGARRAVVIHEVCHLVDDHRAALENRPRGPVHGQAWQRLMEEAGLPPERLTRVNGEGIAYGVGTRRPVEVECACGVRWATRRQRDHILAGTRTYRCTVCGGEIALV